MKYIGLVLVAILLTGCVETRTEEVQGKYNLPDELRDCQMFDMESKSSQDIIVVRCPNSTTSTSYSYQSGKTHHDRRSVVIDGVTFIEDADRVEDPNKSNP